VIDPNKTLPVKNRPAKPKKRFFTPEEANRALILVRRITEDVTTQYKSLVALRTQLDEIGWKPKDTDRADELRSQIREIADRLRTLHEELQSIGCEMKDWSLGLIDFPAMYQGREVLLCWRLGEKSVEHWHERDAGYAGRQRIDEELSEWE
jgi:hypothetical protein